MPTYESTQIRVKPFLVGAPRDGYVVIRTLEGPCYLSLTLGEWKILQRLADLELTLDAYVKWHLAGRDGLSFHEALQLLLRLQKAGFFEEVFSEGVMQRLEELEFQGTKPIWATLGKFAARARYWLDYPLKGKTDFQITPMLSSLARSITSLEGTLAILAVLLVMAYRSRFSWTGALYVVDAPLKNPAALLLQLSIWFSIAGLGLGALEATLLKGDSRALVPWGIRFCSLFFLRMDVQVDHTLLLTRGAAIRHFALVLSFPWFGAFAFWWAAIVLRMPSFFVASFSFACFGAAAFCPFYRSALVRCAESLTGSQQLLSTAKEYLRRKVFAGLMEKNRKPSNNLRPVAKSLEYATHALAAVAFAWLYICGLAFLDLFGRSLPRLAQYVMPGPFTVQFWPSALLIAVNTAVVALLVSAFAWILAGNVAAVAQVPLRRARRGLSAFTQRKTSFIEALTQFLKDNPVFADLPASKMEQLCQAFKMRRFRRGELIVEQGEQGNEFFVLADGDAQVVLETPQGFDLLALLHPGDSFGEVALIEGVVRTASIRAASNASVLVLERRDFDSLFPENSDLRKTLSQTLRSLKLVQESQAMSHLSPRQMREFLAIAKPVTFKASAPIVTEGENAEHAYVLVSGTAKVCHSGDSTVIARLGAGDLVGMTGIIKATRRTADVIAETEVKALKLERDDFLKLCMTNIFVAILIANLSENQSSQNNQLKKKPA